MRTSFIVGFKIIILVKRDSRRKSKVGVKVEMLDKLTFEAKYFIYITLDNSLAI